MFNSLDENSYFGKEIDPITPKNGEMVFTWLVFALH